MRDSFNSNLCIKLDSRGTEVVHLTYRRCKMDESTRKEIVKQYKSGKSMCLICEVFAISRQRVWEIAKKAGCEPRRALIEAVCPQCGKTFKTQRNNPKAYCNNKCYFAFMRSEAGSYIMTKRQRQGLSVRQWQRRARNLINKDMPKEYVVHHLDGDITNCVIDNLFVFFDQSKHMAFHHRERKDSRCKPKAFIDGLPSWAL